jgi:hypothetical protein
MTRPDNADEVRSRLKMEEEKEEEEEEEEEEERKRGKGGDWQVMVAGLAWAGLIEVGSQGQGCEWLQASCFWDTGGGRRVMFRGQPLEAGTTSQQPAFSCTALAAHLVYSGHGSAPFKGSMKLNKSPVPYSLHHQLCKGSPSKKVYRSLVDQFSKMLQTPVSRSIDTSPPVSVLRTLFNLQHQDASQRKIEITISAPQPPAPEARFAPRFGDIHLGQ